MKTRLLIILPFLLSSSLIFAQISTTDLKAWYIADSVVLTAGFVSEWTDYSGNGFHLNQTNAINRPIQTSSIYNEHTAVQFDGSNDYLIANFGETFDQAVTFFIVWKLSVSKAQNLFDGTDGTDRMSFYYPYSVTNALAIIAGGVGIGLNYNKDVTTNLTISSLVFDSTSEMYDNGNLKGSSSTVGSNSLAGLTVGANYNNSRPFAGDIAEMIVYNSNLSEEDRQMVENYLMDKYAAPLDLGYDINVDDSFCDTLLIIDQSFSDILWSTGETNDTIFVNETGEYYVEAKDAFGRTKYDTINVQFPNPNIQNTTICLGDSVLYDAGLTGTFDYLWSDLSTDTEKYYKQEGNYWVEISDSYGCSVTENFFVDVDSFSNEIWLGNDTSLCSGNTISLINGEELCVDFLWTPGGSTESYQYVNTDGWQKIDVVNSFGCIARDSIIVTIIGAAPTPDFTISNFCLGDHTVFTDASTPLGDIADWQWIFNENDTIKTQNASWEFMSSGEQNVKFIVESMAGCAKDTSFNVFINDIPFVDYDYNQICTGVQVDFLSEIVVPSGASISEYTWFVEGNDEGAAENFSFTFPSSGEFDVELEVVLDNSCFSSFSTMVDVLDSYPDVMNASCINPVNYSIVSAQNFVFEWNQDLYALSYKVLISYSSEFDVLEFDSGWISETNLNIDLTGFTDTVYWKVIGLNPCLNEFDSEIFEFYIFSPNQYENLLIWSEPASVVNEGGFVSEWIDLSGNGNDFIQANVDSRPEIIQNDIFPNDFIRYDGVDDYLNVDFGQTIDQPITGFVVWKNSILKSQNIFDGISSEGVYMYFPYSVINTMIFSAGSIGGIQFDNPVNDNLTLSSFICGETSHLYDNFVEIGTGSDIGSNGLSGLTVGAKSSLDARFFNGDISEIILYNTELSDEDRQQVELYLHDKYFPPVNLGHDFRITYGFCDTAIKTAYKPWFTSYEWSTGETDSIIHVNKPGLYTVTVTDIFGFESSDDIRVFYPQVNEYTDTLACLGETLVWDLELAGDYTYEWFGSGETTQSLEMSVEGQYAAILTDTVGCQYKTDTINFILDNYELTASIGPADTTLCAGNRLMLVSNADETVGWEWSTAETSSEIVLSTSGEYSVTTTNWRGCVASDTINVNINGVVPVPAFESLGHCAQNPVNFTDLSTSSSGIINSWEWSIDGEIFSNEQNPSWLSVVEASEVEVILSIETDDGCGDFISQNLTIYPLPTVFFTPELVCQNTEIEFTSTSTVDGGTIISENWEFPASWLSGVEVNVAEATTSGSHTVQLISITDAGCADSAKLEVFVKPAALPMFSSQNTCLGDEVYFINETQYNPIAPVQSQTWDFGDGSSTGSETSPLHTYTAAGTYDVSLGIRYANGCELNTSQEVEIFYNPDVEIISLHACEENGFGLVPDVSLLSGNIATYQWEIGDPVIFESELASPDCGISDSGSYPISLTVESDLGCSTTVNNTLIVHEKPISEFLASRTWGAVPLWIDFTNNSQDANAYSWAINGEVFSTDENPYFVFQDSGTYVVELTVLNEYGCSDIESMKISPVVPLMDIILYSLRTEMDGDYLKTSVYIINNGTLPVEELNLDLSLGNGKVYRETIENFESGQVMDYTFTFKPYLADGQHPDVVCVEAVDPTYGIYTDMNLENNSVCNTNVENLMVFQPYPNPVNDQLVCEFITANPEDVALTLVNGLGKVVYKTAYSNHSGYQKQTIDVSEFSQGVYYLQVRAGEEKESFKVEVNR